MSSESSKLPKRAASCGVIYEGVGTAASETRIDRLALERQHSKDALVNAVKRLLAHEALECLDAQRELAKGERPLQPEPTRSKAFQILR